MRIQGVGLEHHCNVAVFGRHIVDDTRTNGNFAVRDRFQTGDHPQERRFPTSGRPDENDEFAVLKRQADAIHDRMGPIRFDNIGELQRGHRLYPLTAPEIAPCVMNFCTKRKRMSVGTIISVEAARPFPSRSRIVA